MSQQNKLLFHLKTLILDTFTAAAFPSPSEARLAWGWGAARSGRAGTERTAPLDACGGAMLIVAAGAVDGALCLACSGDSSGAALHKPGVAAHSDAWHGPCLPLRLYAETGAALAVRAVGDRGSHQWDFVFWLWLELHQPFL